MKGLSHFLEAQDCFNSISMYKPLILFYCAVFWFIWFKKPFLLIFIGYLNCASHLTFTVMSLFCNKINKLSCCLLQLIRCASTYRWKYCHFKNRVFGRFSVFIIYCFLCCIISTVHFFITFFILYNSSLKVQKILIITSML